MTSIEYISKLNKQSLFALQNAEKQNATETEIANIKEKIKCQTEIMVLLMKEKHNESEQSNRKDT